MLDKKIAIVIPTKNEEEYLPRLIQSIEIQTYKNYVVIVADADSKDRTRDIAKDKNYIVVEGGMPYAGRNNGAKKAMELDVDLIVFIDSDIILPDKYFLQKAIDEFYERNLDIAGTLQIPYDIVDDEIKISKNIIFHSIYSTANLVMKGLEKSHRPMFQVCMFVKPEVHKKIRGFKALEYGEDSKYSIDARHAGFKFGILRTVKKLLISPRRYKQKGFFKSGVPYFLTAFLFGKKFVHGKTRKKYFD